MTEHGSGSKPRYPGENPKTFEIEYLELVTVFPYLRPFLIDSSPYHVALCKGLDPQRSGQQKDSLGLSLSNRPTAMGGQQRTKKTLTNATHILFFEMNKLEQQAITNFDKMFLPQLKCFIRLPCFGAA